MFQQRRPIVPRGLLAAVQHIVPFQGRNGDGGNLCEAKTGGEELVLFAYRLESFRAVVDQVHLVDRQHHPTDADQGNQIAVTPGLGQNPLACIDQDHRHLGS